MKLIELVMLNGRTNIDYKVDGKPLEEVLNNIYELEEVMSTQTLDDLQDVGYAGFGGEPIIDYHQFLEDEEDFEYMCRDIICYEIVDMSTLNVILY